LSSFRKRRLRADEERWDLLRIFAVGVGVLVLETARVPVEE
jgi:hypothetical protein